MFKIQIPGNRATRVESSNSTSTKRLVRAATPRTEFRNMKHTNHL